MKVLLGAGLAALIVGSAALADEPPANATWSRPTVPVAVADLTAEDLSGNAAVVPGHAGQVVLLHFWATWCGPCLEELPALERMAATLAPEGVITIAISEDKNPADVRNFAAHHPATPHLVAMVDPRREVAKAVKVGVLPTTVIVGRDGTEIARLVGSGDWTGKDFAVLKAEVSGQPPTDTPR